MSEQEVDREVYIRECEIAIRRLFPWWLWQPMRRLAGYTRRDLTNGHIWQAGGVI